MGEFKNFEKNESIASKLEEKIFDELTGLDKSLAFRLGDEINGRREERLKIEKFAAGIAILSAIKDYLLSIGSSYLVDDVKFAMWSLNKENNEPIDDPKDEPIDSGIFEKIFSELEGSESLKGCLKEIEHEVPEWADDLSYAIYDEYTRYSICTPGGIEVLRAEKHTGFNV